MKKLLEDYLKHHHGWTYVDIVHYSLRGDNCIVQYTEAGEDDVNVKTMVLSVWEILVFLNNVRSTLPSLPSYYDPAGYVNKLDGLNSVYIPPKEANSTEGLIHPDWEKIKPAKPIVWDEKENNKGTTCPPPGPWGTCRLI